HLNKDDLLVAIVLVAHLRLIIRLGCRDRPKIWSDLHSFRCSVILNLKVVRLVVWIEGIIFAVRESLVEAFKHVHSIKLSFKRLDFIQAALVGYEITFLQSELRRYQFEEPTPVSVSLTGLEILAAE